MSSNVTTKICVDSIRAQIPHIIPGLSHTEDARANHFKRYHKSGSKGAAILRRFHATHLPLLADVTEHPNGDLDVHFLPMWEWDQSLYGVAEDFDADHYANRDILAIQAQHVRADQFVFSVGVDPQMGTFVNVCPLTYWQREHHMWDSHVGAQMLMLGLPFQLEEEMESVFSIWDAGVPLSGEQAILAMARAGFVVDNAFISFMNEGVAQ